MTPPILLRHRWASILFSGTFVVACAAAHKDPPSPTAPKVTSAEQPSNEITADVQPICDLVCERARVVPRPRDEPDYTARATENANATIQAMHEDLLACYKKRVRVNPEAHAYINVDIVIGEDGHVRNVETTGGALLGQGTMSCIVERIRRASFDPPHGGGTLRIHVPFSLRRRAADDTTF